MSDDEICSKLIAFTLKKLLKFSVYSQLWPLIIFRTKYFSGTYYYSLSGLFWTIFSLLTLIHAMLMNT